MSLRHALLGLLAEGPASGYDLTKQFEGSLMQWAWHTTHSHVYPELRRMTEDELVEVVATASRGRKTYGITDPGRQELRRWLLADPLTEEAVRSEAALRMFLLGNLEPAEAIKILQDYADRTTQRLETMQAQINQAPAQWRDNPFAVGRLVAERGLRTLPAVRDWALWCIEQLSQAQRPS
ncbi:PadR family transcriptional regulator [Fodinicola feengrottensis]|uniref:Helix-turn-helix transcriptional regulator n=1 Tax=Fodinicola feengrottensis TaxID=435914 RepID=A0ABN2HQS9_9ACTN|nr:PadR family transcriptional regulator [Fodinicola feengrottensis]